MLGTSSPLQRVVVRSSVASVLALVCAAIVDPPVLALVLCTGAVAAAGVLHGISSPPASGTGLAGALGLRRPVKRPPAVRALGAAACLVALPATWRALAALDALGHTTGSPWRWAPLVVGAIVFALGHRVAAGGRGFGACARR